MLRAIYSKPLERKFREGARNRNKSEDLPPFGWILLLRHTGGSSLSFSTGAYHVRTEEASSIFILTGILTAQRKIHYHSCLQTN